MQTGFQSEPQAPAHGGRGPAALRRWALAGPALLLLPVFLNVGCSTTVPQAPAARPVWPAPPAAPRIAYVRSFSGPADVGIKVSSGRRMLRWVFGWNKAADSLAKPFGVALDEDDNVCLTDTGANAVFFHDRVRKTWQRWDSIEKLRFISPVAVAKHKETIFVADSGLAALVAFSDQGRLIFQVTNGLVRPAGLAISQGKLFVADSSRHKVVVFDLQGKFLTEFGRRGTAPGEFNFPTHVAADTSGRLLVTDSLNGRVQVLDGHGNFQSQIGSAGDAPGHFGRPKGTAVDATGHIYIVDALFDTVQIFDRSGQLLLNIGGTGPKPGEFWLANGIAISRTNEIFVADAYNQRVQVFQYVGGAQ